MTARLFLVFALAAFAPSLQAQLPPAGGDPGDARAVASERVARNYHRRIAVAMAGDGQPRDLALAAILHDMASDGEGNGDEALAGAWRQRAGAAAAGDVLANALLASPVNGSTGAGSRQEAARRWAQREPDNIAPLLFLDGGVEQALAAAADLRRFDLHMYDQVRWMRSVLLRHPPTPSEFAVLAGGDAGTVAEYAAISAMGLWAAAAMPPLQDLVDACSAAGLRVTAARSAGCARLARILAGASDSSFGRMAGVHMLGNLAADAPARAEAQALQRRMDWQMLEWGRISASQPRAGTPQFVRLLDDPQVRSEQDLIDRILGEAGVPLDPPAGWQPPRT